MSVWGLPEPLAAEHSQYGPILILAWTTASTGSNEHAGAIFIADDGKLRHDELHLLTAEWRFNWRNHTWTEVSGLGEEFEQDSDGGPEISGELPESDGADRSDTSDEGDEASRDMVPGGVG